MSSGPIVIFDKSALQGLNVDEAALLGQFFRVNMTPLFFVETLADLEKKVREGQTPEQVVGGIARKTANLWADPNAHHDELVIGDLLQEEPVDMDTFRPHVKGGRTVYGEGKQGVVFEVSPEHRALSRWQKHQFLEIEREMARDWREALKAQRIEKMDVKKLFARVGRPRTLAEVRTHAEVFVHQRQKAFASALDLLRIPARYRGTIFARWLAVGAPPISVFAPYAAYVAMVKLFFQLAVSLDLISGDRPSNSADIAYLFYLPFCMIFISSDKLHSKTAPLFMSPDQEFVNGVDLKSDLRRIDETFSALPQEVLDRGLMMLDPPEGDYLTTRLWNKFLPGWTPGSKDVDLSDEKEAEIVDEFRRMERAPSGPPLPRDTADFVIIKRDMPVKMGKWRLIAQDVAERSWAAEERERAEREAQKQSEAKPTETGGDPSR